MHRTLTPRAQNSSPPPFHKPVLDDPRSTGKREPGTHSSRGRTSLLAAPVWLVVLLASGLPLAWIAFQIVSNPRVLVEAIPDAFRLKLLGRTLLYNGAAAAIATAIGIPVGLVLGRGRGIVAKLMWVALPVS